MVNMSHSVPRLTGLARLGHLPRLASLGHLPRLVRRPFTRLAFVLLALAALAPAPRAAEIDAGKFLIYLRGRTMGYENFFIDQYADSVVVESMVRQLIIAPDGDDSLMKTARLFVSAFDLDLRHYESSYTLGRSKITRGLILADTSLTSYREVNGYGTADVLVRPPGRIYVHDPDVYALFDVISRNLLRQEFDSRPITLMVLGPRDTTLEVTATRLPPEPLRWGARTLQARRLKLDDGTNQILMWSDTRGRLLKLEEPVSGLRVVRAAPAVKPRARRPRRAN